ncbi:c-type cytochrome [Penaeicola halotolerans]|uniref:c-type cytochrome n=1 Tax=Penaeicola halotolerans TaxID=2793196 RepID=UPI001CF87321|nr:cytochrome c [Penaeicola halotolerans]
MRSITKYTLLLSTLGLAALTSCSADGDNPGVEYAPQMYHSIAYEPLSQTRDKEAGKWLSNREDGLGEFYNSNDNNPHGMNMREPAPNTVQRTANGYLPYRIPMDSLEYAARVVKSPIEPTEQVLAEGMKLYTSYCAPCHGDAGDGNGSVGQVIGGVANFKGGAYINITEGHIFHVITQGKGRMGAHGSQITPENRWKIVHYVKQLQTK